jgi:hypothetical protein
MPDSEKFVVIRWNYAVEGSNKVHFTGSQEECFKELKSILATEPQNIDAMVLKESQVDSNVDLMIW